MDHVNRLFDRKAIRELEDIAIDSHGIPGITLMRRAGLSAFDLILDRWPNIRSITVVCGTGNNGPCCAHCGVLPGRVRFQDL